MTGLLAPATRGLAQLLGTLDGLAYAEGSPLPADAVPVTTGLLHPTSAAAVAVAAYHDGSTSSRAAPVLVQVRVRHPRYLDGLALLDTIRDHLRALRYVQLDGLPVSHIHLQSTGSIGPDSQGRHEWTQNYHLLATRQQTTFREETP